MSGPILKGRRRRRHSRVRIEPFQALAAPISILRNRQAVVGSEAPPPPPRPLFRRFAAREESAGRTLALVPSPAGNDPEGAGGVGWTVLRDAAARRLRRGPWPPVDFAATAFWVANEAETQQKQRDSFRASEMNGF